MAAPVSSHLTTNVFQSSPHRSGEPVYFTRASLIVAAALSFAYDLAGASLSSSQCRRINSALYARDNATAYRSASSESGERSVGQRMHSILIALDSGSQPCLHAQFEQRLCRGFY